MADLFARSLRNNSTPAERRLWQQLRTFKSEGRHFRKQVRIDKYVADLACHYPKIVVELDGGQHSEASRYDEQRSEVLKAFGYKVLRFWNIEIFESLEGMVDQIRHAVKLPTAFTYDHLTSHPTPTPAPPHKGEGIIEVRSPQRGGRRWSNHHG